MDMIERVAREISAANGNPPDLVNKYWTDYRDDAKAAIAAMRDPSEGMIQAIYLMVDYSYQDDGSVTGPREAWQAGIDAALGDA